MLPNFIHCLIIIFRLFIIEGVPSIILAAFSAWYLPNKPETAKFLTDQEREFAVKRLENGIVMHIF